MKRGLIGIFTLCVILTSNVFAQKDSNSDNATVQTEETYRTKTYFGYHKANYKQPKKAAISLQEQARLGVSTNKLKATNYKMPKNEVEVNSIESSAVELPGQSIKSRNYKRPLAH